MKRKLLFLACALIISVAANAQYVTIPDAGFVSWLNNNGYSQCLVGNQLDTTCPAVLNTTYMDCESSGIQNLAGLQYFKNLTEIECRYNIMPTLAPLPPKLQIFRGLGTHIKYWPPLPQTLTWLDCRYCIMDSLPPLPSGLQILDCSGDSLTALPDTLPPTLTDLWCGGNLLSALPVLPATLTTLDISNSYVSVIAWPVLPSSITYFTCLFSNFTDLPSPLPASLYSLDCRYNKLTTLPSLPSQLNYINCSNNQLSVLPILPNSLLNIYCYSNQLTSIPNLPPVIAALDVSYNDNLYCLPPFQQFTSSPNANAFLIEHTHINCLPNTIQHTGFIEAMDTLPICSSIAPSVNIAANPSGPICSGTGIQFTATPTNGGASPAYNWKVNGVSKQNSASATFNTAALNNSDSITCDMTNSTSCPNPATATSNKIKITVNPVVTPTITITSTAVGSTVCNPTTVKFGAAATNKGTSPIYVWKVNGKTVQSGILSTYSRLLNNTTAFGSHFNITCTLTSNAPCATTSTVTSNTISLSVISKPLKTFISGQAKSVCGGSQHNYTCHAVNNATSYTWTVPTGCVIDTGQGTTSILVTFPANYDSSFITVTANNQCGASAAAKFTVKCSSREQLETEVQDATEEISLKVYPNPSSGQVFIDLNQPEPTAISYKVFNVMGQQVYEYKSYEPTADYHEWLDLSNQPGGMYFLQVKAGEAVLTRSIVIAYN